MGHVEFRDGRTKGWPHRNAINLYIYVAWKIIERDFCGRGKREFFEKFGLYNWKRNWGVIINVFYYYFYGIMNWNVSKKIFDIKWWRYAFVGGWLEFRICINSCVDLILFLFGIYGTIVEDFWYIIYESRDLWNNWSNWVTLFVGFYFTIYVSGFVISSYFC